MPTNAILNSSDKIVRSGLKDIARTQLPKKRIIGPRNIYLDNTIDKTDQITAASLNLGHMSQYIASSTFVHCSDGWNFLSRATDSIFNGDIPTAIHLIYYSELRAVMCLMSCYGIGVFNKKHFYFDNNKDLHFIATNTTHGVSEKLLAALGNSHNRNDQVFSTISVRGYSLTEWIEASNRSTSSPSVSVLLKQWLNEWSLDLELREDQNMRNETSYRPHFTTFGVEPKQLAESISVIWEALEPTVESRFWRLDQHLLRIALEVIYRASTGRNIGTALFEKFVQDTLSTIGLASDQTIKKFLLRQLDATDHFIIANAKRDIGNKQLNYEDPTPMFCRSVLLLRLATGTVNRLLRSTGVLSSKKLDFWWQTLCDNMGLTEAIDNETMASDLYVDVSTARRDITENMADGVSVAQALRLYNNQYNTLKQFQRSCFWGIGL